MLTPLVYGNSNPVELAQQAIVPCVESDLPAPEEYLDGLKRAHRLNRYSNFGDLAETFSTELLKTFGAVGEDCITCNSATAGLSAALVACGVAGRVLVPAFTFPATFGAVRAAGLTPLVMDVDPESWAIAPERLAELLASTGAKAVVLVAPFGLRMDFSPHIAVCRNYGAFVIIDCAAGLGVERTNYCREDDLFEVFSLHATKPLGIGEGGAVFCSPGKAPLIRSAINFGLSRSPQDDEADWGFNGKLSELHAAVGLAQLQRHKALIAGRQRFAACYVKLLAPFRVAFPKISPEAAPWQVFPVLFPSEPQLIKFVSVMQASKLEARRYYRPSLSMLRGAVSAEPCPISEHLASCMVALPIRSIERDEQATPIISRIYDALMATFQEPQ